MRVLGYVGALAFMAGGGCSYSMTPAELPPPTVIVHNESDVDVEVFLWDGWNRATRLGTLAASDTTSFLVPDTVTAAPGPYHLEARGLGGVVYPVQSETFELRPGYRITWPLPPTPALGAGMPDTTGTADTSRLPTSPSIPAAP